jgi:hypothetical protein
MVDRKGAGYSMEAIVAVATVIIFVLGGLSVPDNQNWAQFRSQVSADDLTYALQESGYLNHAMSEGEVGSVQTAVSSITERNIEVSGLVSNLPIAENSVAFYTNLSDRHTQGLEPVNGGCEGDLEEIASRSEEPVLRTDGTGRAGVHSSEVLYVADLDPAQVGGNNQQDYDSLWVDNGTECQFSSEEGPYYLDNIFRWEDESYDLESIDGSDQEMRLFSATQAVRFRRSLNEPVNSVETFVNIDAVNFAELDQNSYNVAVLRSESAVEQVDSGNQDVMESFMETGSLLVLANLTSSSFDPGDFMARSGFRYVNVSYADGYSGGETGGFFPSNRDSQDTQTYFAGLGGEGSSLSVVPPGVISNTQSTVQSSPAILRSPTETYNFSAWNRTNSSMETVDPSAVEGEPESACYSTSSEALTRGTLEFPDGKEYSFINANLATSAGDCSTQDRGIKLDIDGDGYEDEPTLLNNQILEVANRRYAVDVNYGGDPAREVGFTFVGDRAVELVSRRKSFPEYDGNKIAVSGYEDVYEGQDRKLMASVIHWLRGDEVRFTGLAPPSGVSTGTYSGIQNRTYMPYELNLRWSG